MNKPDLTRRSFLGALAGFTTIGMIDPVLALQGSGDSDALAFSNATGLGPDISGELIENRLIPLHQEVDITSQLKLAGERFDIPLQLLQRQFLDTGLPWQENYKPVVTEQHYGVSENSHLSIQLRDYCAGVTRYLERGLPELSVYHPDWRVLKQRSLESGGNVKAYVGRHTYVLRRFSVSGVSAGLEVPYLLNARPVDRAVNVITPSGGSRRDDPSSVIYIIAGATSLTAPFSELLHLLTHQPAMHYLQTLQRETGYGVAKRQTKEITEALTEAAAISLSMAYIQQLGRADKLDMVLQHARSLNQQFAFFAPVLNMVQAEGAFNVIKQYRRDPFSIADKLV